MLQPKSQRPGILATLLFTLLIFSAANTGAHAQTYSDLYNFGMNSGDPLQPLGPGIIAQGRDGNLYSTTPSGGTNVNSFGAVFRITPKGKLAVLHSFSGTDGSAPVSGLVLGTDGNFYGATSEGGAYGYGTVFKITPGGRLITLYSFTGGSDGGIPYAAPVQGTDENFYGTTSGANGLGGVTSTVYKITPSGTLTTLYQLNKTSGTAPLAPLVQGIDGNFYGVANGGGKNEQGTIFKITPKGVLTVLHNMACNYTCGVYAPLIQASDGYFYGAAASGGHGAGHAGALFRISSTGQFTLLYSFDCTIGGVGCTPVAGLVQATDGNFYGAANAGGNGSCDCGTIFQMTAQGAVSALHSFDGASGATPDVTLVQQTTGIFYGDTFLGGLLGQCSDRGCGVFYSLNANLPAFVTLLPYWGRVGKTVEFLGQGFTGTTAVSFNGVPATFKVGSDTYLTAVVPSGAATGLVTVATPSGTLKSNRQFRVRK